MHIEVKNKGVKSQKLRNLKAGDFFIYCEHRGNHEAQVHMITMIGLALEVVNLQTSRVWDHNPNAEVIKLKQTQPVCFEIS